MLPSYGFFIRDINGLQMQNVNLHLINPDGRPAFVLDSAKNVDFRFVNAPVQKGVPYVDVKEAENVSLFQSFGEKNKTLAHVTNMKL